jgi:hypothetical protein
VKEAAIPAPDAIRKMPVDSVRVLRRALTRAGLTVTTGGSHLRVETADGAYIGTLPITPSDPHALRNCRAWLARRAEAMRAERSAN